MIGAADRTTIRHLRVSVPPGDALAVQMRTEAALRPLDIQPAAMPARAILCIRSMADPLPGGIDVRSSCAPRATKWETAAREAIGAKLRHASRAAIAAVPANAEAVLFADRSELLAAAARDARHRALSSHWWWERILPSASIEAVAREWLRSPEYVPAAMELLASRRDAAEFARLIEPRTAASIIVAVLCAHGAEEIANEVIRAFTRPAALTSTRLAHQPSLQFAAVSEIEQQLTETLAIEQQITETLAIEQRVFVVLSLALRRAPAVVRRASFARDVAAWLASLKESRKNVAAQLTRNDEGHRGATSPEPANAAKAPETPPRPDDAENSLAITTVEAQSSTAHEAEPALAAITPAKSRSVIAPATVEARPSIRSPYAGIFFFISFWEEEDIALWDFLALVGRAIAGEDFELDPLWPLLADLAGRDEETPPGAELEDLEEWLAATLIRIREQLARRLALPPERDPMLFVLDHRGRIETTPSHVDVYFVLAGHPIEIRLSGLDRDPGWIPAAGRHVAFHFD